MTFREFSARVMEPFCQGLMIFGIVALCQPWVALLHQYGITLTLIGLVGFSIFSKIKPVDPDD
jgi:hypothetical protein